MKQMSPEYLTQNWPATLPLKNGTYSAEENQSMLNAEYYLKNKIKLKAWGGK